MNFFDEQDRYFAMADLTPLLYADPEVHTDEDLGWPAGAVAAVEEHSFPEAA